MDVGNSAECRDAFKGRHVKKYKLVPVEEEVVMNEDRILSLIPKSMRSRAKMLLEYVNRIPEIEWNEHGEVILNGEIVTGSHIADYLKMCLFEYKSKQTKEFHQFYQMLHDNHVPPSLLVKRSIPKGPQQSLKPPTKWIAI